MRQVILTTIYSLKQCETITIFLIFNFFNFIETNSYTHIREREMGKLNPIKTRQSKH